MSSDAPAAATYPSDPYYYSVNRGAQLTAIFFLLFLLFLILLCVYCCCQWCSRQGRRRRRRAAALISILSGGIQIHELDNAAGLDSSVIASLPAFTYRKPCSPQSSDVREEPALECAVCLGAVEEGEVVRLLPNCKHVFHVGCIDEWLRVNSTCPVCRGKVVPVKEPAGAGAVADQSGAASVPPLPPVELRDVGDTSAREPASADGAVATKEVGSTSRLASSFRKIVGRDWSGRRSSAAGVGEDDVERQ